MASSSSSSMVLIAVVGIIAAMVFTAEAATAGLEEKCATDFTKLGVCLTYATGKAAAPSKDCCTGIEGIKESNPECLCFIMQQTHSGSERAKSLGIQEGKLLQLPSACNLKNASLANCPKLLGLAPNSPDAAIFTSNSTTAPATTTAPSTTAGSGSATSTPSGSHKIATPLSSVAMAVLAIVLFVFTTFNT